MTADTASTGASLLSLTSAESEYRRVNGVELHVVTAGEPADPLVVLLHGFPEFWYGWRASVEPLVEAGYRVLVPDQRGYNLSDKPSGIRSYTTAELSADVVGLIESEDRAAASVVGHDWGAAVAWDLALRHPDRVERLGIVNVPHPTVFARTLRSSLRQLRRSWYVLFFQLPRIPEWASRRNDFAAWVSALQGVAEPGAIGDEEVAHYRTAWRQPGAVTAMLNWYRALRKGEGAPRKRVAAPTLVIWGENDPALIPEMAGESLEYCDDGHLERFPDATHWVTHERSEAVTRLLLEHLTA